LLSLIKVGLENKRKENRINYLQKRYETMYDKGEWNKNQYKRFVDVISSTYMMTRTQRKKAKYIIDKVDLRSLNRGNRFQDIPWEGLITAICFYIMKKDNNKRPIRYNTNFVRSVSLTKPSYNLIQTKLEGMEDSHTLDNTYYIVDKEEVEEKE
jgi:hypothetical protein